MPTIRRRHTDPGAGGRAPLRSSLAEAAWAVEDRVVWGAADVLRGLADAVKWPFQRIAWATENWLIWPIQEETALWSRPVKVAVLATTILLAAAGVAAGISVSGPSGGDESQGPAGVARVAAPLAAQPAASVGDAKAAAAAAAASNPAAPVLHGSNPDFVPESGGGVPKAQATTEAQAGSSNSTAAAGAKTAAAGDTAVTGSPPGPVPAEGSQVAGPAAIKVARRFASAFALYETGRGNAKVKSIFRETATPDLARALIRRPPRLPANVKVPKAKVLNIVAGPKHGDTYILSASLLRVGVTSELRLDMTKTPSGGGKLKTSATGTPTKKKSEWKVTDVLG